MDQEILSDNLAACAKKAKTGSQLELSQDNKCIQSKTFTHKRFTIKFLKPSFQCPAVNPKSVERVRGEESITDLGGDCGMVSGSFLCVL